MAYKFQLGPAVLSGSLTQQGNVLADGSKISGSTIAITDASGLVGNGIQTGSSGGSLEIKFKAGTASGLAADTDGMFITSSGVTNDMLSGSIAAGKINFASDHFNDNAGALEIDFAPNSGLEIQSGNGLRIDLASADALELDGDGLDLKGTIAGARTFSGDITIGGNLTVQGSSVEIQQGFVVTSSVQFEGSNSVDGFQISLTSADPAADRTITLPDLTGHIPLLAGAVNNANVTADEFALLDGGSTVVTASVVNGDAVLFNDGGVMKHINVTSLKTYFQTGVTADTARSLRLNGAGALVSTSANVSNDVTLVAPSSGLTLTMPDIDTDAIGKVYVIKDFTGDAGTTPITIVSSSSGHALDVDSDSIQIQSAFGAVNLLACSSSQGGFSYAIF